MGVGLCTLETLTKFTWSTRDPLAVQDSGSALVQLSFLFRCLESLVRSLVDLLTHSFLPFTDCPEFCVENYAPLCGNDRKTYENKCYFKQAQCKNEKLAIAYKGECKGE